MSMLYFGPQWFYFDKTFSSTLSCDISVHRAGSQLKSLALVKKYFLKKLEGGCSVPVGVSTVVDDSSVRLEGGVWSLDGTEFLKGDEEGEFQEKDEGSPPKKTKNGDLLGTFAAIKAENLDQVLHSTHSI